MKKISHDIVVIGAGAAGLFFAGLAGAAGHDVLVIDHRQKIGEKIRISGGGRCNFTNIFTDASHFISQNRHFVKSALAGFSPQDFIALVERYHIAYHEKKFGQLFCDDSAQQIIDMLLGECRTHQVKTAFGQAVKSVSKTLSGFEIRCEDRQINARRLVIATGGLSIPKIGATGFGYEIARQFGMKLVEPEPALVPLTFTDRLKTFCAELSGLSVEAVISHHKTAFAEGLLFTHRGLTGPSVLQISSYWQAGENISVDLLPGYDAEALLLQAKKASPKQELHTALSTYLPKRLSASLCAYHGISGRLSDLPASALTSLSEQLHRWQIKPAGTEGYRTAEVTRGGVDTADLSSTDMQSKRCEGLYFIGEVVDVTGHLGGHNFQWAWASAAAAARHL